MGITYFSSSSNGVQYEVVFRQNNEERMKKGLLAAYYRGLKKIGMQAEKYAKQLPPVDTGRLRNSIK